MQIDEATYQRVVDCLEKIRQLASTTYDMSVAALAKNALETLKSVTIDGEGTLPAMQKLLDDFDARHPEIIARIDAEEKA